MAKRNNKKASELKGIGIYQDPKKGTILYNFITKKGYQLTSGDVPNYSLSKSFLPIAIIVFYILNVMLRVDSLKSLIAGISFYIIMRIVYHIKFLSKLPCIENYQRPEGSGLFQRAANDYSYMRLNLLAVMSLLIVILTIIYIKTTELDTIKYYCFLLLTLGAVVMMAFSIISMIVKSKNKPSK